MPFVARCPNCTTELDIGEDVAAGQAVECPICLTRFVSDHPPALARRDRGNHYDEDEDHDDDDDRSRRRFVERLTYEEAIKQVLTPALGLQITGWVGALLSLFGGVGFTAFAVVAITNAPPKGPNQGEAIIWMVVALLYTVFGTLYFAAIAYGAAKMKRLESWGWGMTAAILGILTAVLCGLCLPTTWAGMAFGIWALVVLSRSEIKAAFPQGEDEE